MQLLFRLNEKCDTFVLYHAHMNTMPTIHENTKLLIQAAERGDVVEVQRLIPLSDAKAQSSEALQFAVYHGHIECVKLLIPVSNPKDRHSSALQLAARHGHTQCVKLLIPVSDPKADDSLVLQSAAYYGHTQCVQLLIPVLDAKAKDSLALRFAALNGHNDCVDLLFDVSDVDVALKRLKTEYSDYPEYLENKITAQKQRKLLTQETSNILSLVKPRKM